LLRNRSQNNDSKQSSGREVGRDKSGIMFFD
jgi:hypothetical protein